MRQSSWKEYLPLAESVNKHFKSLQKLIGIHHTLGKTKTNSLIHPAAGLAGNQRKASRQTNRSVKVNFLIVKLIVFTQLLLHKKQRIPYPLATKQKQGTKRRGGMEIGLCSGRQANCLPASLASPVAIIQAYTGLWNVRARYMRMWVKVHPGHCLGWAHQPHTFWLLLLRKKGG